MSNANPVDIILDMVVGSIGSISHQSNGNTTDVITANSNIIPMINSSGDDTKTPATPNSTSRFSFKKTVLRKIFGSKKNKHIKKNSTDFAAITTAAAVENTLTFYNTLRKGLPRFKCYFSDTKIAKELLGFDIDLNELNNMNDNTDNNNENVNNTNENANGKDGLELFFHYVQQTTSEFTEEEVLELEMRILKIIRNIKGKRDLKQHLRRYAASMNFKEHLFYNNVRCNI